jgi:hypothetical protein
MHSTLQALRSDLNKPHKPAAVRRVYNFYVFIDCGKNCSPRIYIKIVSEISVKIPKSFSVLGTENNP